MLWPRSYYESLARSVMEHKSPDLLLLFFGGVRWAFCFGFIWFFSPQCFTYFCDSSTMCLETSSIPKGIPVQSKHAIPLPMSQTSWPRTQVYPQNCAKEARGYLIKPSALLKCLHSLSTEDLEVGWSRLTPVFKTPCQHNLRLQPKQNWIPSTCHSSPVLAVRN